MKTSIFLSIALLIIGSSSIFAQQRGNTSRGARVNTSQTRTVNVSSSRTASQDGRFIRNDGTVANSNRIPPAQRPNHPPNKKTKISKLLRGLELSDPQKRKINQIFKEARLNGSSPDEVLRQINSVLRPEQSEKFVNKIKRIKNQHEPKPKPKKLKKVLRKVELSNNQWMKVNRILKNAKENDLSRNEVLRQINSILRPEQSREFKHLIKRIYKTSEDNGNSDESSDAP